MKFPVVLSGARRPGTVGRGFPGRSIVGPVGLLFCCFCLAVPAGAQSPSPDENPAIPTVTFDCLWEAATPQAYTIWVRSTGSARYVSSNPVRTSEDRAQDPDYSMEFTLSSSGSARVFALALRPNTLKVILTIRSMPWPIPDGRL